MFAQGPPEVRLGVLKVRLSAPKMRFCAAVCASGASLEVNGALSVRQKASKIKVYAAVEGPEVPRGIKAVDFWRLEIFRAHFENF